jgi:hypothetical protein
VGARPFWLTHMFRLCSSSDVARQVQTACVRSIGVALLRSILLYKVVNICKSQERVVLLWGQGSFRRIAQIFGAVGLVASASALAEDTPIAPWDSPTTPQKYHPDQRWGTACKDNKRKEKILLKKFKSNSKPVLYVNGENITLSTEDWFIGSFMGVRFIHADNEFLIKIINGKTVKYEFVIRGATNALGHFVKQNFNAKKITIYIKNKQYDFNVIRNFSSPTICDRNLSTGFLQCSAYAESSFQIEQGIFEQIAQLPDLEKIKATFWMNDGIGGGCPITLLPLEFKMLTSVKP